MADLNPINDDTTWPDKSNSAPVANRGLQSTAEDWAAVKARFLEIYTEVGVGPTPPSESIKGLLLTKAVKGPIRYVTEANATVQLSDQGGMIVMIITSGTDRTVAFPQSLPINFDITVARVVQGGGYGRVSFVGTESEDEFENVYIFAPNEEIIGRNAAIQMRLSSVSVETSRVIAWATMGDYAPQFGVVANIDASAPIPIVGNRATMLVIIDDENDITLTFQGPYKLGYEIDIIRVQTGPNGTGRVLFDAETYEVFTHTFAPVDQLTSRTPAAKIKLISYEGNQLIWTVEAREPAREVLVATGFSSTKYFRTAAAAIRGNLAGFTNSALIRFLALPTDDEVAFGCFNKFQNDGGFYVGVDSVRFKMGIAQDSTGGLLESAGTDTYQMLDFWRPGGLVGRNFLLTQVYDGTNAVLYVNETPAKTLVPSGGYRLSDAALRAMVGRNTNAGAPTIASAIAVQAVAYKEEAMTAAQVASLYEAASSRNVLPPEALWNWDEVWLATKDGADMRSEVGSTPLLAFDDDVPASLKHVKW